MTMATKSIPEAFATVVATGPDHCALLADGRSMTYAQLSAQADQVAQWLLARGIGRGKTVGLYSNRSPEAVAAILGILRTGAAYVPLDTSYPSKLLQYIHDDCTPAAMLVQESLLQSKPPDLQWNCEVLTLTPRLDGGNTGAAVSWPEIEPADPAYIMYTSGSTGRPKGVVVPHRAVLRLVIDNDFATLGPHEVILHLAPLSFDASTFELWGALLNGGKLAVISNPYPSLDDIAAAIAQHGVTTLWLTAGLFHLMVDNRLDGLKPVRQLLAGGDVLSPPHVVKALRALPQCRLINGYGPTENTTFSCCYTIPADYAGDSPVPIGRAIRRTQALVLDDSLQPVSPGCDGELYVGGDGLALGYVNQPALTAERFLLRDEQRVYKTGDRVRARPDGNLEFLGRVDRQVKINGKRVELDEIEARLRATGLVQDAAVVCPPGTAGQRLIAAFITGPEGATVDLERLRRALREDLPEHMIPASITQLDAFPLSPTGKVDRSRLPLSTQPAAGTRGRAPANETETALIAIWQRVIGRSDLGVDDNFFDLGGTSLGLMDVHASIRSQLASDISVVEMFQYPRISALAERIAPKVTPRSAPPAPAASSLSARDRAARQQAILANRRPRNEKNNT
jgi:amino acid adenylation domain-containing protein